MASAVATVLVCVVVPVAFSYTGSNPRPKFASSSTQSSLHWRRRLQHAVCGLVVASGYKWFITDACTAVALLSLVSVCFLELHKLRSCSKAINDVYLRTFGPLLRPHEIEGLPGAYWFMLGSACAVALFPRDVALQSILHLSMGDPVASLAGITMGERNRVLPAGKSLAGFLAAFLACATSTLLLFGWFQAEGVEGICDGSNVNGIVGAFKACTDLSTTCAANDDNSGVVSSCRYSLLLYYSVLGGLSGAVGECLPLRVDDNLSMPMVSGTVFLLLHHGHSSSGMLW